MAENSVNGSGNGARSGAQTLLLLSAPLSVAVLEALVDQPQALPTLRGKAGSPAQTTLRTLMQRLTAMGAVERRRLARFPGTLEYELTLAGTNLLSVLEALQRWLARAPEGPLHPGAGSGRVAVKALADGWSTLILRAMAAKPLSLTELDGVISSLSYPAIERRLAGMRMVGQIEAVYANERRTPYAVTGWLREGIAPLVSAAYWEHSHIPEDMPPFGRLDSEAAFLLAAPLARLAAGLPTTCRIAVVEETRQPASIMICIDGDGTVSSAPHARGDPDAWALGPASALLSALVEPNLTGLELGGDRQLAQAVLDGIRQALFGVDVSGATTG